MAEDDRDRIREAEAEREAEIESEMERVGQDPDQVNAGRDSLGTQNAPSGSTREAEGGEGDEDEEAEEAVTPDEEADES